MPCEAGGEARVVGVDAEGDRLEDRRFVGYAEEVDGFAGKLLQWRGRDFLSVMLGT